MVRSGGIGLIYRFLCVCVWYPVDVVPNLLKWPVPVSMLCRYQYQHRYIGPDRYLRYPYWCRTELTEIVNVRYMYWYCTEITEASGTGMKVCTGIAGTGIHVVPNLPNCPISVLMSYPTYRSVRYRYWCYTKPTDEPVTGITGVISGGYASLRTVPNILYNSTFGQSLTVFIWFWTTPNISPYDRINQWNISMKKYIECEVRVVVCEM